MPRLQISRKSRPFAQCKVSIAVDVSGSTGGWVLNQEKKAIQEICHSTGLPYQDADRVKILPWSWVAQPIISFAGLSTLQSGAGTSPKTLIKDKHSRTALKESFLWFLFTDGKIYDHEVANFSQKICNRGLQGTACVIVLFASKEREAPAKCDVSVGMSLFAHAPDVLFLFHDIYTEAVYILQCKGCFNSLLPVGIESNPILRESTTWSDLPQIEYGDLARIQVPVPRHLGKDDFILQNGQIVNFQDLGSDRIDEATSRNMVSHPDNINTIANTAKVRGLDSADKAKSWLASYHVFESSKKVPRQDIRSRAESFMVMVLGKIDKGEFYEGANGFERLQKDLRNAHTKNLSVLTTSIMEKEDRKALIEAGIKQISSKYPSRLRSRSRSPTRYQSYSYSAKELNSVVTYREDRSRGPPSLALTSSNDQEKLEFSKPPQRYLYTPGYIAEEDEKYLDCPICGAEASISAFLLKPSTEAKTSLSDPLSINIISQFSCCESCSQFVVKCGHIGKDNIISSLPLVSLKNETNRALWISTIRGALGNHIVGADESTIISLFTDMLNDMREKDAHVETRNESFYPCDDMLAAALDNLSLVPRRVEGRQGSNPDSTMILNT